MNLVLDIGLFIATAILTGIGARAGLAILASTVRPRPEPLLRAERPRFAARSAWGRRFGRCQDYVEQAGLPISPRGLVLILSSLALVIWGGGLLGTGAGGSAAGFLGVTLGATLAPVAIAWIGMGLVRARRLRRIEMQLPMALNVMSLALRAGQTIIGALALAADGASEPLRGELSRVVSAMAHGADFRRVLEDLGRRIGSPDVRFFAIALGVQLETGGDPTRLFEGLNATMRARALLRQRIRALVAEGEASAWLMTALPLAVFAFQLLVRPAYFVSKFSDPIFWPAMFAFGVMLLLAWAILYRITHFKY